MKPTGVRKRKVEIIGGGRVDVDQTESLSDDVLDDREIAGYLNTKEEIRLKRIIWERLNHQYAHQMAEAKKLKKERDDAKKAKSKGTSNNSKGVGSQMRSTMVNYDALKQLDDELNDDNLGSGADILGSSGSLPRKSRDSDAKNLGVQHDEDEEEQSYDRDDEQQHDEDDDDTWRYNNNNYESSYDYDDDTLGDTNNYDDELYHEYEGEYYE